VKKLDLDGCSSVHFTLKLLLQYLVKTVKCRSRSLAVYSIALIGLLGRAFVAAENHRETTNSLKICYLLHLLNTNCIHFKIVLPDLRAVRGRHVLLELFSQSHNSVNVRKQVGLVKSFARLIFCENYFYKLRKP